MTLTRRLCLALFAASFCLAAPAFAQQGLTPAQSAWLKAETRKAEARFVTRVAGALKVPPLTVQRALPSGDRIADPVPRLFSALERDLGRSLTDDERAEVRSADEAWRGDIVQAQSNAPKR